jgi:hypothetical protein
MESGPAAKEKRKREESGGDAAGLDTGVVTLTEGRPL